MHGDDRKKAKKIIEKYANECKLNKDELTHVDGNNRFWYSFANKCFMLCCKVRSVSGIGFQYEYFENVKVKYVYKQENHKK